MSINAINGLNNNYQQQKTQVQAIKPETQKELQALGINSQNIKTETQAQAIIKEFKELQQQAQAITAGGQQQSAQAVQPQNNVQDIKGTEQVNGTQNSQQTQAFAGGQAATAQASQKAQPFEMLSQIMAQENKLKLGLI